MHRVGEHPVHGGPLAPRWLAWSLEPQRAGVDVGRARGARERRHGDLALARRRRNPGLVPLARHARQPDRLGRAANAAPARGRSRRAGRDPSSPVTAPRPPGAYRLAFDLVEEHRFWFEEVGCTPLDDRRRCRAADQRATTRRPRSTEAPTPERLRRSRRRSEAVVEERRRRRRPPRCRRATRARTGRRVVLDAHAEGWQAVGTAIIPSGRDRAARAVARGRRPQPTLRAAASAALAARRSRAVGAPRPAGLHRDRRAVRRARLDHTSAAIRSSTALKTAAPRTSATHGLDDEVDEVRRSTAPLRGRAAPGSTRSRASADCPTGAGRSATGGLPHRGARRGCRGSA